MLVYILVREDGARSYVGATVNFARRLRQHNGALAGGARYTSGQSWRPLCTLHGFLDWRACLSCEWHVKRPRTCRRDVTVSPENAATLARLRAVSACARRRIDALRRVLCDRRFASLTLTTPE